MGEAAGKAWAALAVRELGKASAEIADGVANGGGLFTLVHVRGARTSIDGAIRCLVYAEGHLKDAKDAEEADRVIAEEKDDG